MQQEFHVPPERLDALREVFELLQRQHAFAFLHVDDIDAHAAHAGPVQQVELDAEYIERRCLRLDVQLLLRTVPAVLTGRGAY
ncbi:MAG: hypothetical protein HYY79_07685 [Betaproteobacteria bacterium]|nr:hypothetical protein [Betaproteobacteria bacterium]